MKRAVWGLFLIVSIGCAAQQKIVLKFEEEPAAAVTTTQ